MAIEVAEARRACRIMYKKEVLDRDRGCSWNKWVNVVDLDTEIDEDESTREGWDLVRLCSTNGI